MLTQTEIIDQTKKWINDVVIGLNFCPFASNVVKQNKVHYEVEASPDENTCIDAFLKEVTRLQDDLNIETSFLICPNSFLAFGAYLDGVSFAEHLLKQNGYEGTYQVASFHPLYRFAGSPVEDPANYTNRSVYPMFQLLREASIDIAVERYGNLSDIPKTNIAFARKKGLVYMKSIRGNCM